MSAEARERDRATNENIPDGQRPGHRVRARGLCADVALHASKREGRQNSQVNFDGPSAPGAVIKHWKKTVSQRRDTRRVLKKKNKMLYRNANHFDQDTGHSGSGYVDTRALRGINQVPQMRRREHDDRITTS